MQDKGRGSLTRPPASHTAPQSGSELFHRWSEFLLFAVAGGRYQEIQRENRSVLPFRKVAVQVVFIDFARISAGVSFSAALTTTTILPVPGGDMRRI